ncbi:MAG: hypothetical protein HY707_13020 [Ignavibacteriae bacterium]|nr:hypothetical protein [Ignavibacteriota bacterium]
MTSFLTPKLADDFSISLGLSGGLDSRVILALLLSHSYQPFSLHVFGNPNDPDVQISRKISEDLNVHRVYFDDPSPLPDECLKLLNEYIGQTCVIEPASSILRLRYYARLHSSQKLLIDGGFGEIARRQYFNRLFMFGKKALHSRNPHTMARYIRTDRPFFFREEVRKKMEINVVNQLDAVLQQMPTLPEIGIENFLDLLAIRTRFPNWGAYEQSRMDSEVMNFMPFAQLSFLHQLFMTPVWLRRNGKLFRELIREKYPKLRHYSLVKGSVTYPFFFSTTSAILWTKMKAIVGMKFVDRSAETILSSLSEFVLDTVGSNDVKHYPYYDYAKILRLANEYYAGNMNLAYDLDWWLAFEIWRQVMNLK